MKFHKFSYITLTVLIFVLLCMTAYATVTHNTDIFFSKFNIFLFALFFVIQVICIALYKPKFTVYRIGFYVMHFGLLIMLVGFLAYYISGEELYTSIPVDKTKAYPGITKVDNDKETYIDFGFHITVEDFRIEYYEKEEGQTVAQPKQYYANLKFTDPVSLQAKKTEISVNSPVKQKGWKIYLMSHSPDESELYLLFKKDPAENVTTFGIYMTMIGGVLMCLIRKRKAGDEN